MTTLISSFIACLFIFSVYRPFITSLDKVKYILLGSLSFIMPFTNYQRSQTTILHSMNGTLIKELSLFKFISSADLTYQLNDDSDTAALKDSFFLLSITIFTVSLCGLLTRWQFPITFVMPRATNYISGFMRHAISMCLVLLAILRYFLHN